MKIARRVAVVAVVAAWLYSWSLFRGVRAEFAATSTAIPTPLILLMGGISTFLIATGIVAGLKARIWPALAVIAGVLFALLVVTAQHSVMQNALEFAARSSGGGARSVPWDFAAQAALRSRGVVGAIFVTAVPLLMVLSGITGFFASRLEVAHG